MAKGSNIKTKVDFSKVLKSLDGTDLRDVVGMAGIQQSLLSAGLPKDKLEEATVALSTLFPGGKPKDKPLTAAHVVATALQNCDGSVPGPERIDRIRVALLAMDPKQPVEVNEVDKTLIFESVAKTYTQPIVYFRINELFEAAAAKRHGAEKQ